MRWEIETKNVITETPEVKKTSGYEITTTRTRKERSKVQYITVGDIVEMGKSAAGAVMKLAKKLPGMLNDIRNMKNGNPSEGLLASLNGLVQPLAVVIQGTEGYKTAMKVISILTPIVKTVARGTGVWCSPGNVGDIAEIAIGTVQQILVGIAMSAIMKLKDWIWSIEFRWREIPLKSSYKITKKLKKIIEEDKKKPILGKKKKGSEDDEGISTASLDIENSIEEEARKKYEERRKEAKNRARGKFSTLIKVPTDIEVLVKQISGDTSLSVGKKCRSREGNYITEYMPDKSSAAYRILSGSKENEGIWYSDDRGNTWRRSSKRDLSFDTFAKIPSKDGFIYVAGSIPYVRSLKRTEDIEYSKDERGHYNKDYYKKENNGKFTKNEKVFKEKIESMKNGFSKVKKQNMIMDKDDYLPAEGIWYSKDNGVNWEQSNITEGEFSLFFEYGEKESDKEPIPSRIVAAASDYDGLYYTDDGMTWNRPTDASDNQEINFDRWNMLDDSIGEMPRLKNVYLESNVEINTVVRMVVYINQQNVSMGISETNNILFGEELADRDMNDLIKRILLHIHETHPEIVADTKVVPNEIWEKIISEIREEKYTYKDGENGKHLEEYINGGK